MLFGYGISPEDITNLFGIEAEQIENIATKKTNKLEQLNTFDN